MFSVFQSSLGFAAVIAVFVPMLTKPAQGAAAEQGPKPKPKRPIAVAWVEHELLIAHRDGTFSIVDPDHPAAVQSLAIGTRLSAIGLSHSTKTCLVTDERGNEVIVLSSGSEWDELQRVDVPATPVSVQVSADGHWAAVACLWARQLAILECSEHVSPAAKLSWRVRHIVDLPFAPRCQWMDDRNGHVVVGDAFGDRLAVVDADQGRVRGTYILPGRNIRGLAATKDSQSLVVALQGINEHVPTERDRIVWGAVVSNLLVTIPLEQLRQASPDKLPRKIAHWSIYPLGSNGRGSGDPADLLIDSGGRPIVALGGVDQLTQIGGARAERRCSVGRRPTSLAYDARRERLYVANTLDDSISVVDMKSFEVQQTIALSTSTSLSLADEGERLFYDARLSLDGWYSCHSCHTDGHTTGSNNDNSSDGDFGAPKRIPTLLGTANTRPWAWNGSRESLVDQISRSVHATMQTQQSIAAHDLQALEAYLQTLAPPPGVDRARNLVVEADVERGDRIFHAKGCAACHAPPHYTTPELYDVGLTDERGRRLFNPPSLLAVSQRDQFLHDNRATSLRAVVVELGHPAGEPWNESDLDDLLAFLRSL